MATIKATLQNLKNYPCTVGGKLHIKWDIWEALTVRMHDRWGREFALVSTP